MSKDLERQRRAVGRLKEAEQRLGWLSSMPLPDKVDAWLAHLFDHPSTPWELVIVEADGTRRVLDPRVPIWAVPLLFVALGIGLVVWSDLILVGKIAIAAVCTGLAAVMVAKQARAERHLLFDATRGIAVIYRGHRVLVEIPFEDIDTIHVEVRADPGYSDEHRAYISIGDVAVPLSMWSSDGDETRQTADAVARVTGVRRERGQRRLRRDD